jgi:oligopeptide/dipeptide ABC transporter ATP-binding protein
LIAALKLRDVHFRYRRGPLNAQGETEAVAGVELQVEPGEVVGLIGESGSGKTTLARLGTGLLRPDRGGVEVLGQDLSALGGAAMRLHRRRFQLVFQDPSAHLNPGLRVEAILAESARLHRPGLAVGPLIADALSVVGLSARRGAWPHQLSGGEKRRVGLAQIHLAAPDLVVADEPTAGLDAALKADLLDVLLQRQKGGCGYLIVSHDLPLVAAISNRIAVMLGGRILEELPTDLLNVVPHHPYTTALLAAAGMVDRVRSSPRELAPRSAIGCPFAGACHLSVPTCHSTRPALVEVGPGHRMACPPVAAARPIQSSAQL